MEVPGYRLLHFLKLNKSEYAAALLPRGRPLSLHADLEVGQALDDLLCGWVPEHAQRGALAADTTWHVEYLARLDRVSLPVHLDRVVRLHEATASVVDAGSEHRRKISLQSQNFRRRQLYS